MHPEPFKLEVSLAGLHMIRAIRMTVQDAFEVLDHLLSSLRISSTLEEVDVAGYFRKDIQEDWAPVITRMDNRMTEDTSANLKRLVVRAQPVQDAPGSEAWMQIMPNASRRGILQVTHHVLPPFEGWQ
jgi:hypothetical protein